MSSRARNFRRRGGDDDDNEEDEKYEKSTTNNGPATVKTVSKSTNNAIAKPKKPSTPVPKSLLSFADEGDEESSFAARTPSSTSRVPRPSSSSSQHHKLSSAKDRKDRVGPHASSLPSNVQPQAGTYTKEALLELQKNTRTLAPSRPARPEGKPKPEATTNEPVIVLKGLVKPKVIAETDGETDGKEQDSDNEEMGNLMKGERDEATARLGSMALGKGFREKTDVPGSVIPDQATIEAIRAKRERLRLARAAAPDYIALDSGSNHGAAEGLSDEEPEFQGRIGFLGEKVDKGKKGVFEDFDQRVIEKNGGVESGDDEDEEDKMWEEEQVRKGLGKRLDDASNIGVSTSSGGGGSGVVQSVHQQKVWDSAALTCSTYSSRQISASGYGGPSIEGPSIGGAVGGLPGLDVVSISQQAELAKKALNENLGRLKESHSRTVASLTKTDENLSTSLLKVTTLENSLSALGEKFIFMQKLRDFVSVICEFLQHKAPYIEELEDHMQKLQEERAAAILERRLADNDDEMRELESAVEAAKSVFSRGGNTQMMIETAKAAAQAALAASKELKELPVELDEFGRDVNKQKRMDLSRRAEARQRRRNKSDLRRLSSVKRDSSYQLMEGELSTDESESESSAFQSNRSQLLQTAEQIFSDAREDYSKLSLVIEKFEKFKKEHASSYRDSYMSLSVPTIFSPFVRLELLKWDPLHKDADFINMNWHTLLFSYGLPEDESEISSDDADVNLIPELVEKLAVPILHHQLAHCWDMLSTRETKYAVAATNLVFRYVALSSSALGKLVSLLRDRLAEAVANLMIPTWDPLVLKAVPNAARVVAYRFGMSVRLMRNICLWNRILAMPILENIALDELLNGKILPHLRIIQSNIHDAIARSERIVASLDGVWSGPGVTGDRSPKLQPLVDYLLKLGEKLEKKHAYGGNESETAVKLARRLKKMLVELNEYDHARAILRTFNLKEAL